MSKTNSLLRVQTFITNTIAEHTVDQSVRNLARQISYEYYKFAEENEPETLSYSQEEAKEIAIAILKEHVQLVDIKISQRPYTAKAAAVFMNIPEIKSHQTMKQIVEAL